MGDFGGVILEHLGGDFGAKWSSPPTKMTILDAMGEEIDIPPLCGIDRARRDLSKNGVYLVRGWRRGKYFLSKWSPHFRNGPFAGGMLRCGGILGVGCDVLPVLRCVLGVFSVRLWALDLPFRQCYGAIWGVILDHLGGDFGPKWGPPPTKMSIFDAMGERNDWGPLCGIDRAR